MSDKIEAALRAGKAQRVATISETKRNLEYLSESLEKLATTQLAKLLGRQAAHRLQRAVLNLVQTSPEILECEPRSLILCVLQAAYLNLDPSPALGHVYFVPFRIQGVKKAQLVIGYKGWIELAYRSEAVRFIQAHVVRRADQFSVKLGTEPSIVHVPSPMGDNPDGNYVIAAYATALVDGSPQPVFEVMWRKELDAIQARAPAGHDPHSPWNSDYEAMAKAKVVRRLIRWLPKTLRVQEAVTLDEYTDAGVPVGGMTTEEALLAKIEEAAQAGSQRAQAHQEKPAPRETLDQSLPLTHGEPEEEQ